MKKNVRIGVVGDFNEKNPTHHATNHAIAHAAAAFEIEATVQWLPTLQIEYAGTAMLRPFDALWCSPGSPYVSMSGALEAICFARKRNIPFFGT